MMERINYRGYTASLVGTKMTIRDWNGDVVAYDPYWKYSFLDVEDRLKEAIDKLIALGPFIKKSWWK